MTYEPTRWPAGIITGYEDGTGGFIVEHVITFNSRMLIPMLHSGIQEAQARGYRYISFAIPENFPLYKKLAKVANYMGFKVDGYADNTVGFVRQLC